MQCVLFAVHSWKTYPQKTRRSPLIPHLSFETYPILCVFRWNNPMNRIHRTGYALVTKIPSLSINKQSIVLTKFALNLVSVYMHKEHHSHFLLIADVLINGQNVPAPLGTKQILFENSSTWAQHTQYIWFLVNSDDPFAMRPRSRNACDALPFEINTEWSCSFLSVLDVRNVWPPEPAHTTIHIHIYQMQTILAWESSWDHSDRNRKRSRTKPYISHADMWNTYASKCPYVWVRGVRHEREIEI